MSDKLTIIYADVVNFGGKGLDTWKDMIGIMDGIEKYGKLGF